MANEDVVAGLEDLLARDPAYADVYASVLEACEQQCDEQERADWVDARLADAHALQTGPAVLGVLVRAGGLQRTVLVDGEPYAGTLAQLQADEAVPDYAEVAYLVQSTPAGLQAARNYRATMSLEALFAQKPEHVPGFRLALETCQNGGASTRQVQQALVEAGVIRPGLADAQTLHASYFTSTLERRGALVWRDKAWHATEKGAAALESLQ